MAERKRRFFADRSQFEIDLKIEINRFRKQAAKKGAKPAVRLNVGSDIDWRRFTSDFDAAHSGDGLPAVHWYDYTKVFNRAASQFRGYRCPENYHLTYSVSERSEIDQVYSLLKAGVNCAIVFDTEYNPRAKRIGRLPVRFWVGARNFFVVDGDKIDVRRREIDGAGRIIGLRFKGSKARKIQAIESGFCVETKTGTLSGKRGSV
jgi:hypothetical protein